MAAQHYSYLNNTTAAAAAAAAASHANHNNNSLISEELFQHYYSHHYPSYHTGTGSLTQNSLLRSLHLGFQRSCLFKFVCNRIRDVVPKHSSKIELVRVPGNHSASAAAATHPAYASAAAAAAVSAVSAAAAQAVHSNSSNSSSPVGGVASASVAGSGAPGSGTLGASGGGLANSGGGGGQFSPASPASSSAPTSHKYTGKTITPTHSPAAAWHTAPATMKGKPETTIQTLLSTPCHPFFTARLVQIRSQYNSKNRNAGSSSRFVYS